jgi:methionyl aminopeptidase
MVRRAGLHPGAAQLRPPATAPYPKSICTSINHQVCHGVPGEKALKKGDIVNLDITVIKDGYHGDTSRMFLVGGEQLQHPRPAPVPDHLRVHVARHRPGQARRRISATSAPPSRSMPRATASRWCASSAATASARKFHEDPQVLHYGKAGTGPELKPGMIFTIEPMINAGKAAISELPDGWTIVTKDRSLSAQWEHMVVVTETGVEVLTLSAGSPAPPGLVAAPSP